MQRRENGNSARNNSAKLERKRIQSLRKNYERSVAKNGEPPILYDIHEMIGKDKVDQILTSGTEFDRVSPINEELTVTIDRLSAHGDGLALSPAGDRVIAVPFSLPGETVRVYPYAAERLYLKARLVERLTSSDMRRDDLVNCRYFGTCGGCQYQMIPYEQQLELKKRVVHNAFKNYAKLQEGILPEVLPTMGSPATMAYRTKLTPHFDLPSSIRKGTAGDDIPHVPIGFDNVATGRVMDIEECPIGTPTINAALPQVRASILERIKTYKNGATVLLRDSLPDFDASESVVVTDHKATVHEIVGKTKFSSPAGAFFQNNRSIIPLVIEYIEQQDLFSSDKPQYLVDTYCGSGLFALTLAPHFHEVAGVEISAASIECAKKNAELNGITNATFLAGNAENIFANISYPPEQTTVVIDPPRRGCDDEFIKQLVALRPANIVYDSSA
ncbi:tRNA (uracil(54)-C(5))-methyltransferase [Malassezia cuniculi]|uniref:tRNA (Uracil(54)-C(5))-methyltransferase n=1 Tax=Malassezia cuniculi TaxID=948313 RepID=A0AAF0EWX1_9BASI|nr:tRNA (uracil(54)-C(5))-methyltransferase [Malassezia cuniculi]